MISSYSSTIQTVAVDEALEFDINRISTGCTVKHADGTPSFVLTKPGYYYVFFNATVTDTAAGVITVQLQNGTVAIPGAVASTTIAADTDEETISFATIVRVLPSCCAIDNTTTLTFVNTGAEATYSVANVNVTKLC